MKRTIIRGYILVALIAVLLTLLAGVIFFRAFAAVPLRLNWLWPVGGGAAALAVLVAWLNGKRAAARLTEPIQRLVEKTGTFDWKREATPSASETPDEILLLDRRVTNMIRRLSVINRGLEQQNERLHALLQAMDEGVITVNRSGWTTIQTRRATEFLGPVGGEANCSLALKGQNYARLARIVEDCREAQSAVSSEMMVNYPLERVLNIYASPIGEDKDTEIVLVIQDVTRLKKLEEIRQDFVANVTHELKTPLTSICGYVELLRSNERDEETRRDFYEIIEIEADRLLSIVQDLLQLGELERRPGGVQDAAVRQESCLLDPVVKTLIKACQPLAIERQVTLRSSIPENFSVPGSSQRQQQLLMNLISNGIMYNRPGGYVEVSAGLERDLCYVKVKDNGIGIAKKDQERVFERFYRVQKERSRALGGTGLGLAIVKHLAGLLGGRIVLNSEPGRGSEFIIYYPPQVKDLCV